MTDAAISEPEGRRPRRKRKQVLAMAELVGDFGQVPVRLLDLSETGARISAQIALAQNQEVELRRGDVAAPARIIWARKGTAGLEFSAPVPSDRLLGVKSTPSLVPAPIPQSFRPEPAPAMSRSMERKLARLWTSR